MKPTTLMVFELLLILILVQALGHEGQMSYTAPNHLRGELKHSSERKLTGNYETCITNYSSLIAEVSMYYPSAAYIPSGGLVVVWAAQNNTFQNNPSFSVQGVLYNSEGNVVGGSFFTVSPVMTGDNYPFFLFPSVVVLSNNYFAVIWGQEQTGAMNHNIFGQIYSEAGVPIGSNFEISSNAVNYNQMYSQSSSLSNGEFVVCWQGSNSGSYTRIQCQIVGPTGNLIGSLISVDSDSIFASGNGQLPSVTTLQNGNFVVNWNGQLASYISASYAKIFTNAGAQVGPYIVVSSEAIFNGEEQFETSVCPLDNGGFSVNWIGRSSLEKINPQLFGKTFSSSGSSTTSSILLTSGIEFIKSSQSKPTCASLGNGEFVRVWPNSYGSSLINTEIFLDNGMPTGNPTSIASSQFLEYNMESWVVAGNNGEYIVIWAGKLYQSYNADWNIEIWGEQFNRQGLPTKWVFPALSGKSSGLSGGQIAGIVIGCVVFAILVVVLIHILNKRMLEKRKQDYIASETKKPTVEDASTGFPSEKAQVSGTKKPITSTKSPPDKAPAPEEMPILSSPKDLKEPNKSDDVPVHEWLKDI